MSVVALSSGYKAITFAALKSKYFTLQLKIKKKLLTNKIENYE